MKSLKVKLSLIAVLALTFVITLGVFIGRIALANRYQTLSGVSIFYTSGNAEVWAHREYVGAGEEKEETEFDPLNPDYKYYTMFAFKNNESEVTYRRNLAYRWYYNENDADDYLTEPYEGENGNWFIRGKDTGIKYDSKVACKVNDDGFWVIGEEVTEFADKVFPKMGEGYLRLEIGFEEVNFEKFVITFESQQYNMTKDEKTTNYIVFIPAESENGVQKVYAIVTDDEDVVEKDKADLIKDEITDKHVALDIDHIVIKLGESKNDSGEAVKGEYSVAISTGETVQTGAFKNVGKMYAKYVSSSTDPVTPLAFKAEFKEDDDGNLTEGQTMARMAIYELNGQSFVLNRGADGKVSSPRTLSRQTNADGTYHYEGGQINDTQPPVLCLDSGITYIKESSELSFNYTAVDVLTQSPSTETAFFMLTNKQQSKEGFNPNDLEADGLFETVTNDEDVFIYPHTNHYVPKSGVDYGVDGYGTAFRKNEGADDKRPEFIPTSAIKIYLKLTDTASTGGQSTYVFLDWFVKDEYKLTIGGYDYIAIATDDEGATFNYNNTTATYEVVEDGETKTLTGWAALLAEYQDKVNEAAKDLRAGSNEDFYLPSIEKLVTDNATAYEDMTFSIYYMANGSTMSNSGVRSSQLSIDLTEEGDYIFTVYATDNASNPMWYIDDDGEVQTFTTGEIWSMYDDEDEEGLKERLPWFTFTAGIADISIEDPGEQSTAYVGTSYTASAFEIEGLKTNSTYSLYRFNQELYAEDHNGKVLTYQQFMEEKQSLFENERNYFTNIVAQGELEENSEEYDEFYDYAWNPTSRSFVPQEANAFYLIECKVTSAQFPEAVKEYMGIASSATPRPIKGENTWAQDNLTSIILLSIAGVALLGIILLIFVKPKNKGDIDVQFEQEVAKKNK